VKVWEVRLISTGGGGSTIRTILNGTGGWIHIRRNRCSFGFGWSIINLKKFCDGASLDELEKGLRGSCEG